MKSHLLLIVAVGLWVGRVGVVTLQRSLRLGKWLVGGWVGRGSVGVAHKR